MRVFPCQGEGEEEEKVANYEDKDLYKEFAPIIPLDHLARLIEMTRTVSMILATHGVDAVHVGERHTASWEAKNGSFILSWTMKMVRFNTGANWGELSVQLLPRKQRGRHELVYLHLQWREGDSWLAIDWDRRFFPEIDDVGQLVRDRDDSDCHLRTLHVHDAYRVIAKAARHFRDPANG